jgi:dsRNA-specific ribonuclease
MARVSDEQLVGRLGYEFRNPGLLERALTHSSAVPECARRVERK